MTAFRRRLDFFARNRHKTHRTPAGERLIDLVRNPFVPAGPEEFVRRERRDEKGQERVPICKR